MGSVTISCLHNAGKLGTTRSTEKISIKDPREIWITFLSKNVERKATMLATVNAPLKPSLKRVCNHKGIRNRINLPTSLLVEDTKKLW